jgi:hypothetical protein
MVAATKPFIQGILLFCALGICLQGWAQTSPENLPVPPPLPPSLRNKPLTPPPDLPDPSELYAQLNQLGDLLNMSLEKLNKLRETIEFVEKMSPDEREAMRIRISQITQSTPEIKKEIEELVSRFPEIPRSNLSQFWYAASKDERSSIRQKLKTLDEDKQFPFLNAKVEAFVRKRDEVFEGMRKSLEQKRKNIPPPAVPKP